MLRKDVLFGRSEKTRQLLKEAAKKLLDDKANDLESIIIWINIENDEEMDN